MINCYIPPGSKEENKKLLQSVKSVIRRAKQKYPQNPLIVAGDFNYYYQEMSEFMIENGYYEVFEKTSTFKKSGN